MASTTISPTAMVTRCAHGSASKSAARSCHVRLPDALDQRAKDRVSHLIELHYSVAAFSRHRGASCGDALVAEEALQIGDILNTKLQSSEALALISPAVPAARARCGRPGGEGLARRQPIDIASCYRVARSPARSLGRLKNSFALCEAHALAHEDGGDAFGGGHGPVCLTTSEVQTVSPYRLINGCQ
jgi:hypothetical protein